MPKIGAIRRIGLVSVLAIVIVIAALVVYAFTDTSQMTTVKTTSATKSSTANYITTNTSAVLIASSFPTQTTTQTSPPKPVPYYSMTETNVSTVNSVLGLSLNLFTTPLNGSLGQLAIAASVVNIRNISNNVTDQSNWQYPSNSLSPISPCGAGQIGFGIFQGSYDQSNFSKAISLTLYNESTLYSCTTMTIVNSTEVFSFKPQSDLALVTNSSGVPFFNSNISISKLVGGYWIGQVGSGTYQIFPSGTYTIIAADEWGQLVFLHFNVTNSAVATVTEIIVQNTIFADNACTVYSDVANITTYITPSVSAYSTVTVTQLSNSSSTTTLNPPSGTTTVINGTTVVTNCG